MSARPPKAIRFTSHALEGMAKRGASPEEVTRAIREAAWVPARAGRFECSMNFPYNGLWHGKPYDTKQVVPVFREEAGAIVVITVYAFYF